ASASEMAPLQYIAPYSGCAMAEYFMAQGKDVLIIYDDLSKHAVAYRALSLLIRRPPGREAYPGDVFYLHSRLLERAARLAPEYGGGSITALPIIETQAGDVSAYIPTNVISITDGQIYLESELFHSGVMPAVNPGISVSRVGGSAQIKAMKKVAGSLKLIYSQYRELQSFAQFGSDLDADTKARLAQGERIVEILKQDRNSPVDVELQVCIIYAATKNFLTDVPVDQVKRYETELYDYMRASGAEVLDAIRETKDLSAETAAKLEKALTDFTAIFLAGTK
ncbi:MAG: F0F1 ATP synthase subunit alpha, partial [Clostridia bacterium]|nr:F0F1 ATP synthase subunit alpha [Clostridia bacterium]